MINYFLNSRVLAKLALVALLPVLPACAEDKSAAPKEQAAAKATAQLVSDTPANLESVKAVITEKLTKARRDLLVTDVKASDVPGIYEVTIGGAGKIYVSENGEYFFLGDLYQIKPTGLVNLSEEAKNVGRKDLMAAVKEDDMVIFKAEGETKAVVYIFTDVDCGYCRKLHQEVPEMNQLGIEVRYLAYPRAGVGSPSYNKIASAWCAEDKNDALTKLKNGQAIDIDVCNPNPVAAHYQLGGAIGVRGTPAIIMESGEMIPGYVPAKELAKKLNME